ncbi:sigma-E processing peptidase SpoIIGA [Paenibacillus sp. P96]|uniref:Sigma-E processing peptidase SpoIIGA n=1 Tax=Paenibacillus zeirhizosphaerae TaxID=2987519 RepID=A0ABT9FQD9_9BACL|nr:sigma-E processing peptidase SpoIIGA [Paenibacillus sp. P96]MDP4096928.1 sigma-E processing peptidase SpoIIGA [Paenibacillus sp. P96]
MVVYIDLIFLTNLLIDAVLLLVTAWMRKLRPAWWKLLLSAALGAMYVVMMFIPQLSFMFTFLIKFGLSVCMLLTAFGFGGLQNFLRTTGAFYVVNFVAAGGILGVHYLLQSRGELFNGIWFTATGVMSFETRMAFWFIFCVFGVVMLIFYSVQATRRRTEQISTFIGEVEVCIDGVCVKCTGLLDTGNQLNDPMTRLPVMVMEASLWSDYLPQDWSRFLTNGEADNLVMNLEETYVWRDRLRLVPYRGINRSMAFMLAVKPDEVKVTMKDQTFTHHRVLIGLDGGKLSSEGRYQAVIHPELTASETTDVSA